MIKDNTFRVPKHLNQILINQFKKGGHRSFSNGIGRVSKFCYNKIIQRSRDLSEQSLKKQKIDPTAEEDGKKIKLSRYSNFKAVYIPNIEEESIEGSIINNKERQ